MADLETFIAEKGPLNAGQQQKYADNDRAVYSSSWRNSLRRLLPEGFERHRVADRRNCGFLLKSPDDVTFNRFLIVAFLILTSLVLTQILVLEQVLDVSLRPVFVLAEPPLTDNIYAQTWPYGHFQIEQTGIIFVAILASLLTVGVFAKKMRKKTGSGWPKREEVPTICAHVQQV